MAPLPAVMVPAGATSVCVFRKLPRPALIRLAAHYGLKPESSLASSSLAVAVSEAFACEAVDEEQVHAGLLCELCELGGCCPHPPSNECV